MPRGCDRRHDVIEVAAASGRPCARRSRGATRSTAPSARPAARRRRRGSRSRRRSGPTGRAPASATARARPWPRARTAPASAAAARRRDQRSELRGDGAATIGCGLAGEVSGEGVAQAASASTTRTWSGASRNLWPVHALSAGANGLHAMPAAVAAASWSVESAHVEGFAAVRQFAGAAAVSRETRSSTRAAPQTHRRPPSVSCRHARPLPHAPRARARAGTGWWQAPARSSTAPSARPRARLRLSACDARADRGVGRLDRLREAKVGQRVFVRAIDARRAVEAANLDSDVHICAGRPLEQAAAACREQRIAAEQHRSADVADVRDVTGRVPRHVEHAKRDADAGHDRRDRLRPACACAPGIASCAGANTGTSMRCEQRAIAADVVGVMVRGDDRREPQAPARRERRAPAPHRPDRRPPRDGPSRISQM